MDIVNQVLQKIFDVILSMWMERADVLWENKGSGLRP
jgi:hypothetical protein